MKAVHVYVPGENQEAALLCLVFLLSCGIGGEKKSVFLLISGLPPAAKKMTSEAKKGQEEDHFFAAGAPPPSPSRRFRWMSAPSFASLLPPTSRKTPKIFLIYFCVKSPLG